MAGRLGRLPADPRKLALAPRHSARFAAIPPPPVVDRSAIQFEPDLGDNDRLPVCTVVGLLNSARMVAALNGYELATDEHLCKAFYAQVLGMPEASDDAIAATDGAFCLDVLGWQAAAGFEAGLQTELVGLFGTLPLIRPVLANAIAHLGHAYLGVLLRERDMEERPVWDAQDGRDDGEVVGGHVIAAWDYLGLGADHTARVATWGYWQRATWAWIQARTEEAYGLVWRQLLGADGLHDGVDADQLKAELARFTANV